MLVQKFGEALELPNMNFELEFYNKNNVLQIQKITGLTRKWDEPEDDKSDSRTISQFLDRGSKDNSFDIIDEENKNKFEENHAQASKTQRNLKKKPILIVYPVLYKNLIYPLYYVILPSIKGGKKVQYIVRTNRNK